MSDYAKAGDIEDNLRNVLMDLCKHDGKWDISEFLDYFLRLCDNSDAKLSKSALDKALNKCQNEQCKQMLNKYIDPKNYR